MSEIVEAWSKGTIATTQPPVYSVLTAVLPRSLATNSPDLLRDATASALPLATVMQWLALETWLYNYADRVPTAQCWEDVKGLVEACYHCCRLEQWAVAYQLMCWPVGKQNLPLYVCIDHWGQHQSQIAIFEDLKGKLGPTVDLLCLDKLGHAHRHLGEFQQAQVSHEAHLKLAQERGDRVAEMAAYWGLGSLYADHYERRYDRARSYFQRHYDLANELGDRYQQAVVLCRWGRSYYQQHSFQTGLPLLQKSLEIAQEVEDKFLEVQALMALGANHFFAGDHEHAQIYLKKAVTEEYQEYRYKDPTSEIWALMNLSFAYYLSGQTEKGKAGLEKVISKCQVINDVSLELSALNNIAVCLSQYNLDYDAAINYCERTLQKALEFGFFSVAISNSAHLSVLYTIERQDTQAKNKLQESMALYRNYRHLLWNEPKGIYFAYLANARWLQGQHFRSIFSLIRCLVLIPPWSGANGQLIWRKAVATLTPPFLRPLVQRLKN
jgi:tetratricopeptide (TPR) repeat protein